MAEGSFTRFDIAERIAALGALSDAELGRWLRLVAELWKDGPKPSGLLDGKPSGLLEAVEGGYSMQWIEAERARVEHRKRIAKANGSKSGGRPLKRTKTRRVFPKAKAETQPVTVKELRPETQPVIEAKKENEDVCVITTELVSKKKEIPLSASAEKAATPPPPPKAAKRARVVKVLFDESPVNTIELFTFAFSGDPLAEVVDLNHYFHAVSLWSKGKGERRADWVAVAQSFMLRDKQRGSLVLKKSEEQQDAKEAALREYLNT